MLRHGISKSSVIREMKEVNWKSVVDGEVETRETEFVLSHLNTSEVRWKTAIL